MSSPLATLTKLEADLVDLEAVLLPLMTRPWQETLDALEKPLERAKMNTMAAFGICDLIWAFLKIKASAAREAIDFENHPVMKELITIQGYYRKIKETEFPPKRIQQLDIAAANRFISHAIPQNQRTTSGAADSSDIGRHTRFSGVSKSGSGDVERVSAGEDSTSGPGPKIHHGHAHDDASLCTESFLKDLPKCEHHIHIEGSLSPSLLFRLAAKNDIQLPSAISDPAYESVESLEARYLAFTSLDDFLAYYDRASAVLIHRNDFKDLALAYMEKANEDGIQHTEVFFDLQTHTARGIDADTVIRGLTDGLMEGSNKFGITYKLIMCILRHLPVESSVEHVDLAHPFYTSNPPLLHGLGMCSTERNQPPSKFLPVYARAAELGITNLTAHAGEEGPPSYVREAIELLNVSRIDHGVRSVEDEGVLRMLKEGENLLTVCPLSNVALRVVKEVGEVPLRQLLDAGVRFSLNSDDPAYFGGYLLTNYLAVQAAFSFTPSEWRTICWNAIDGSWCDRERKEELWKRLEEVVSKVGRE